MTLRVLYTTADTSPQSGAFRSLLHMSRSMAERDSKSILALHQEARTNPLLTVEERGQVHFFDLPRPKRRQSIGYYLNYLTQNVQSVYQLAKLIRREQIAIVHINEILDLYAGIAARLARVPCVWHIRADLSSMPRLSWLLSTIILALADRVITVSQSVQDRTFQDRGNGKVVVIHNPGPNPTRFHPDIDGSSVRREFSLHDEACLVTLVAKLSKRKGHETLIRAAPEVLTSFPDTYFMIVGGELEAEHHKKYSARLKSLVEELNIENRVIFTGFRSDIPQLMSAADIVTHCSTFADPFPGVVLQGMACGKPVIASNMGGPREQIEHGISGMLVEPGSPEKLSSAICYLLENEQKRGSMGKLAAKRVRILFKDRDYFEKLTHVYKTVQKFN